MGGKLFNRDKPGYITFDQNDSVSFWREVDAVLLALFRRIPFAPGFLNVAPHCIFGYRIRDL